MGAKEEVMWTFGDRAARPTLGGGHGGLMGQHFTENCSLFSVSNRQPVLFPFCNL